MQDEFHVALSQSPQTPLDEVVDDLKMRSWYIDDLFKDALGHDIRELGKGHVHDVLHVAGGDCGLTHFDSRRPQVTQ